MSTALPPACSSTKSCAASSTRSAALRTSGAPSKAKKSEREYRRVLMPETRYHVYYRVVGPDRVRIVAIWSAVRSRGPRL